MHPSFKFKPLGPKARQIPLSQYNGMGRAAERLSGIGLDGYSANDLAAFHRHRRSHEQFVEMTDSATGEARVLHYESDSWVTTGGALITVLSPNPTYPGGVRLPILPRGERLWAKWNHQAGVWIASSIPMVRFELKDDLSVSIPGVSGSLAEAYLLEVTGSTYSPNVDVKFYVRGDLLESGGTGRDSAPIGDRGYARWAGDRNLYEIVHLNRYDY